MCPSPRGVASAPSSTARANATPRVNPRSRPPWRDVTASLDRYDERAARAAVTEWIDEFMPRHIPRVKGRAVLRDAGTWHRRLDHVLARAVGPWYGVGAWRVGNESFGGCFCHSFVSEYVTEPRREGVRRGAAWVLSEVDAMRACLREFGLVFAQFDDPRDPGDRAAAMSATLGQLFDTVAERTSCNSAWHRYVVDGVAWLLDARSIESPPVLHALIEASIAGECSDFLPVPRLARNRLCCDLATVFVVAGS